VVSVTDPNWIGKWGAPQMEHMERKLFLTRLGLELRPLSRPARSQSLYRLLYLDARFRSVRSFLRKVKAGTFLIACCNFTCIWCQVLGMLGASLPQANAPRYE
jgi:hypothetical protein